MTALATCTVSVIILKRKKKMLEFTYRRTIDTHTNKALIFKVIISSGNVLDFEYLLQIQSHACKLTKPRLHS